MYLFSDTLTTAWAPILFTKDLVPQIGSSYSLSSGIFTAPAAGLYHFDLVVFSDLGNWAAIGTSHNAGDLPASFHRVALGINRSNCTTTGISTDLKLEAGQRVAALFEKNVKNSGAENGLTGFVDEELVHFQFSGYLMAAF